MKKENIKLHLRLSNMRSTKLAVIHLGKGLCVRCNQPRHNNRCLCLRHLEKEKERRKRQFIKRRTNNQCTSCGNPLDEDMDNNNLTCLNCRERRGLCSSLPRRCLPTMISLPRDAGTQDHS